MQDAIASVVCTHTKEAIIICTVIKTVGGTVARYAPTICGAIIYFCIYGKRIAMC